MGFPPNPEKQDFIRLGLETNPSPGGKTGAKARQYYGGLYHRTNADLRRREVEEWRAAQAPQQNEQAGFAQATAGDKETPASGGKEDVGRSSSVDSVSNKNNGKKSTEKKQSTSSTSSRRQTRSTSQGAAAAAATELTSKTNEQTEETNGVAREEEVLQDDETSAAPTNPVPEEKIRTETAQSDDTAPIKDVDRSAVLLASNADESQTETSAWEEPVSENPPADDQTAPTPTADAPVWIEDAAQSTTKDAEIPIPETETAAPDTPQLPGTPNVEVEEPLGDETLALPVGASAATTAHESASPEAAQADVVPTSEESPASPVAAQEAIILAIEESPAPLTVKNLEEKTADDLANLPGPGQAAKIAETRATAPPGTLQLPTPPSPTGAVTCSILTPYTVIDDDGSRYFADADKEEDGVDDELNSLFVSEGEGSDGGVQGADAHPSEEQAEKANNEESSKGDYRDVAPEVDSDDEDSAPSVDAHADKGLPLGSDEPVEEQQEEADKSPQYSADEGGDDSDVEPLEDEEGFPDNTVEEDDRISHWLATGQNAGEWASDINPEAQDSFLPDAMLSDSPVKPTPVPPVDTTAEATDSNKRKLSDGVDTLSPAVRAAFYASEESQDESRYEEKKPEGPAQKRPWLTKPGQPRLPKEEDDGDAHPRAPRPQPEQPVAEEEQKPAAPASSFLSSILHDAKTKPQYPVQI